MQGCGGNCACADKNTEKETLTPVAGGVVFDEDGKCPCGKSKEDCCHYESETNNAIGELCEPHNGTNVCEPESVDEKKTAQ